MPIHRGDSVFLAILSDCGRSRAICGQFGHNHSSRIGGHCPSGERKGAGAKRRRPAGTRRIRSNTAAGSSPARERIVRDCHIVLAMGIAFVMMSSLSGHGQRPNAQNCKLAKHPRRCRPFAVKLMFCCDSLIAIVC